MEFDDQIKERLSEMKKDLDEKEAEVLQLKTKIEALENYLMPVAPQVKKRKRKAKTE